MIEDIIPILQMMQAKGMKFISVEHDILYGPGEGTVTEEDKALLEKHGWHLDSDVECWARHV